MTKRDFQKQFGDKLVELMANPHFHVALDVAREDCPYSAGGGVAEATSIIRNEGRMTGWMECLRYLKTIGRPEETHEKTKEVRPLYADPSKSEKNQKS